MNRSYFWQDLQFFQRPKNENLTLVPMCTFCFVMLTLRNLPMEIGKFIGIYVTEVVLTNACLGFWGTPNFLQGAKNVNYGQHFTRFGIGGSLFHN